MKVSVIIPVYKVEQFIERCAKTLFEQTLADVEYIFVDDASPDKSIEVLQSCIEEYPDKKDYIHIVRHSENKGLPAARNTGLKIASGDYVFHCDSDDYVELDMLERMYATAIDNDADIVWSDFYLSFETNERYLKQPEYADAKQAVCAMLGGGMKFNVWNKLVRRRLYTENGINFPAGYGMGEDMTMIMLFACAKNVKYIPSAFYHYVKLNMNSFTQTHSDRHITELKYNVQRISDFLNDKCGNTYEKEIAYLKLCVKYSYLISGDRGRYEIWQQMYPEANKYIEKTPYTSYRSWFLQLCAAKKQYWILQLHYYFLHKVVYGLIYR